MCVVTGALLAQIMCEPAGESERDRSRGFELRKGSSFYTRVYIYIVNKTVEMYVMQTKFLLKIYKSIVTVKMFNSVFQFIFN